MILKHSVIDLIKSRTSKRSYINREIDEKIKNNLVEYLSQPLKGPFGNEARFCIIDKQQTERTKKVKLGTYGFISGVRHFIAGAIKKNSRCYEDYGYLFEKIILLATDYKLGTCWCGGIFTRGEFSKVIKLESGEVIPGITPVGYATEKRSSRDRLIRLGAGSKSRKSWDELFFEGKYGKPLSKEVAGPFSVPLEMVRLGPSGSNKQPWRIIKGKDSFHFYLNRTRGYKNIVRAADLQKIDMGIAMCHFELSAKELKLPGEWIVKEPEPDSDKGIEYIVSWDNL